MHSASPRQPLTFSPLCFIPSFSLSHFTSLHHLATSFSSRRAGGKPRRWRPTAALWCFWVAVCAAARGHGCHISFMAESEMSTRLGGRWSASRLPSSHAVWAGQWRFCGEASSPALLRRDQPLPNTLLVNFHNSWWALMSAYQVSLLLCLQCDWDVFIQVIQLLTTEYPLIRNPAISWTN